MRAFQAVMVALALFIALGSAGALSVGNVSQADLVISEGGSTAYVEFLNAPAGAQAIATEFGSGLYKWEYRFGLPEGDFVAWLKVSSDEDVRLLDEERGSMRIGSLQIDFSDVLEFEYKINAKQANRHSVVVGLEKDYVAAGIGAGEGVVIDPWATAAWGNEEGVSEDFVDTTARVDIAADDQNVYAVFVIDGAYAGYTEDTIGFRHKTIGGTWDSNIQVVSTDDPGTHGFPVIGANDGNIFIAFDIQFVSSNDYNGYNCTLATNRCVGFKWLPKKELLKDANMSFLSADRNTHIVSTDFNGDRNEPLYIAANDENVFIVFASDTQNFGADGVRVNVWFKHKGIASLRPGGDQTWLDSNAQLVSAFGTSDSGWYSITFASMAANDENLFVVWESDSDFNGAGDDSDILFRHKKIANLDFNGSGITGDWSTDSNVQVVSTESTQGGNDSVPKMATDSNNIYVVWYSAHDINDSDGNVTDVFFKFKSLVNLDYNGNWELDSNTQVVSVESVEDGNAAGYPAIDVNNGFIWVVWMDTDFNSNATYKVLRKFKPLSNLTYNSIWNDANSQRVSMNTAPGISSFPMIDLDSNYLHVAWHSQTSYGDVTGADHIFYAANNGMPEWSGFAPDVNVVALGGSSDVNAGLVFGYGRDGNITIDFNVSDKDINGTAGTLSALIYYSSGAGDQNFAVIEDLNLMAVSTNGNPYTAIYCDDLNFAGGDVNKQVRCHYDWNISGVTTGDANFFIDVEVRDIERRDSNSSDFNFLVDNNKMQVEIDFNRAWQNTDANVVAYCLEQKDVNVDAGPDDVYGTVGGTRADAATLGAGNFQALGIGNTSAFIRFRINTPAGATISHANLIIRAGDGGAAYANNTDFNIAIGLLDSDDQQDFAAGNYADGDALHAVATTSDANVIYDTSAEDWTHNQFYTLADISSLVQSYVDRTGYNPGQYMGLKLWYNDAATNEGRLWQSDDNGTDATPRLRIRYRLNEGQDGCGIRYRQDTADTNTTTFGSWANFDTNLLYNSDGNWALDVNAVDAAGNTGDINKVYIQIDTNGPVIGITSPASGSQISSNNFRLSYSAADTWNAVKSYMVRLDSGAWIPVGTATSYDFVTSGTGAHTLSVTATDAIDNNRTASVSFSIQQGATAGAVSCGNGICDAGEAAATCPSDCAPVCGDGACTGTETPDTCPRDCVVGCGDRICDAEAGETCNTCAEDCGVCPTAGPGEVIRETQGEQPTAEEIESVLRDAGFTASEIADAQNAGKVISVRRDIVVEQKQGGLFESTVTLSATNISGSLLRNARIVELVPKAIASRSSEITSRAPFAVLKDDPILQFTLASIEPGKTASVTYSLAKQITASQLGLFVPPIASYATVVSPALTCENIACNDRNPCTRDLCSDAECLYVIERDGKACGFGRECREGVCRSVAEAAAPIAAGAEPWASVVVVLVVVSAMLIAVYIVKSQRK